MSQLVLLLISFKLSRLTIVDLFCSCISSKTTCSLFNVCLIIFLEQKANVDRIVALNETHNVRMLESLFWKLTDKILVYERIYSISNVYEYFTVSYSYSASFRCSHRHLHSKVNRFFYSSESLLCDYCLSLHFLKMIACFVQALDDSNK